LVDNEGQGPMAEPEQGQSQHFLGEARSQGKIGKQIVLPWRKSIQICSGGIRTRLGRSIVTLLGVVLAIAFLMSVMTSRIIVGEWLAREDPAINLKLQKNLGIDPADASARQRERQKQIWLISLSILVCLVGIVNSMLMSVTERIREIGTMKCLGALDAFIVRLFFLESIFQGLVGTLVGIPLGFLLSFLRLGVSFEFGAIAYGHLAKATLFNSLGALVAGTALTVLAAIYPAYVAAKMQPVEAMRVEE